MQKKESSRLQILNSKRSVLSLFWKLVDGIPWEGASKSKETQKSLQILNDYIHPNAQEGTYMCQKTSSSKQKTHEGTPVEKGAKAQMESQRDARGKQE